eukprot:scaffold14777_cov118-Isochrysis_galbana.AAC.1
MVVGKFCERFARLRADRSCREAKARRGRFRKGDHIYRMDEDSGWRLERDSAPAAGGGARNARTTLLTAGGRGRLSLLHAQDTRS